MPRVRTYRQVKNNIFAAVDSANSKPLQYFSLDGGYEFLENTWVPEPSVSMVKSVLDSYTGKVLNYSACGAEEVSVVSPPMPPSDISVDSVTLQ